MTYSHSSPKTLSCFKCHTKMAARAKTAGVQAGWGLLDHLSPSQPPGTCSKAGSENIPQYSLLGELSSADCENYHQLLHTPHLHCHCCLHLRSPHFLLHPKEGNFISWAHHTSPIQFSDVSLFRKKTSTLPSAFLLALSSKYRHLR